MSNALTSFHCGTLFGCRNAGRCGCAVRFGALAGMSSTPGGGDSQDDCADVSDMGDCAFALLTGVDVERT